MAIQIDSVEVKGQRKKGLTTFRGTQNTSHPPVSCFASENAKSLTSHPPPFSHLSSLWELEDSSF